MAIIMLNKKREISVDLLREALSSYVKPNKIYSTEHLKGYLCAYLNVTIDEIDDCLKKLCEEDFISLNNNNLLYGTIVKLNPQDINRYFINKIARSKQDVTKEDVVKYLRCLPMELRYECIKHLKDFSLKNEKDFITIKEPLDLFLLNDEKALKKDSRYIVEDNLAIFTRHNEYVDYSVEARINNVIRESFKIGAAIVCASAISILGLSIADNLSKITNNNTSIVMNAYTFDTASDELTLQWLDDVMSKHHELVKTTDKEFIKGTYNNNVIRLYQEVIRNYYEYIRVTDPDYYYNNVMNPEDAEEILSMAEALGKPIVPQDGTLEHEAFINSVKAFNEILLGKDYKFEYYNVSLDEENNQSLVLN